MRAVYALYHHVFWIPMLILSLQGCYYETADELFGLGCPDRIETYDASIAGLIDYRCTGCHSGNNPEGGLMLTTYEEVKSAALNGDLLERIELPESNSASMPPNGSLDSCDIDLIKTWIALGGPEF